MLLGFTAWLACPTNACSTVSVMVHPPTLHTWPCHIASKGNGHVISCHPSLPCPEHVQSFQVSNPILTSRTSSFASFPMAYCTRGLAVSVYNRMIVCNVWIRRATLQWLYELFGDCSCSGLYMRQLCATLVSTLRTGLWSAVWGGIYSRSYIFACVVLWVDGAPEWCILSTAHHLQQS